jgi:protein-disulfide isomerase
MPSGKRARQQRQAAASAPPPVRSTGGTGARQASPKVLAGVGGVILIVIIAIVLAVVLSRNGSSGAYTGSGDAATIKIAAGTPTVGRSTSPDAAQGATDVAKLLKGIPQNGFVLGDPNAPVTLVEYIDLQCPDCLQFEQTQLEPLITKYVRKGQLKIKMQPWSILDRTADIHDSDRGQKATIAAAAQNKAFNFAQVLYDNQQAEGSGWMNDAVISNIAASVDGLKPYQLVTDANSQATKNVVNSITDWAATHPSEMTGTPTLYLVKGIGAQQYYGTGVPTLADLEAAIDAKLK